MPHRPSLHAAAPPLRDGAVVVAHASIAGNPAPEIERELLARLPEEMRDRHRRFVRRCDRDAFLLARCLLAELLDDHGTPANCLVGWRRGQHGKPSLAEPADAGRSFDFNLSHSGERVACALSSCGAVGIDVEHCRPFDVAALRAFLSPRQWRRVAESSCRLTAFYEIWTAVESVLKAAGVGLSRIPAEVELDGIQCDGIQCDGVECDGVEYGRGTARLDDTTWHLRRLELGAGYVAHLCCARPPSRVTVRELCFDRLAARRLLT